MSGTGGGEASNGAPVRTELLQFPTEFPLKILGRREDGFADAIAAVVRRHAPDFDASTLEMRVSRQGTYLGLTAHPLVKVVL
jgi:hypothetical protein